MKRPLEGWVVRNPSYPGIKQRVGFCRLFLVFCLGFSSSLCALGNGEATREVIRLKEYPILISYAENQDKVAGRVSDICVETVPGLLGELGLESISPVRITLVSEMQRYRQRGGQTLPNWGVAFSFPGKGMMLVDVQRALSAWNSLEKIIPHELSHLLLEQKVGGTPLPLWFVEGTALWQAGEWSIIEGWHLMNAVWGGRVPELALISGSFPREASDARDAYRVSYAAFVALFGKHPEKLPPFLEEVSAKGNFADAFRSFWGKDAQSFSSNFKKDLERRYASKLLVFQTGPLFTVVAVLFLFAYLWVRWRNRRKLRRLERAERALYLDDR